MGQKKFTRETSKYLEMSENHNTIYPNLWYIPEAVPEGNYSYKNANIKKEGRSQTSHL